MRDQDQEIRLKGDRQAEQTLIAVALVFGAVCLYQILAKGIWLWGIGLVPSAVLFVVAYGALTDKTPRLVISRHGLDDRAFGTGPMPWSAIVAIEESAVRQSRFLCLKLRDPAAWRARMPLWRRLAMDLRGVFGVRPFSIDAQSFKVDADALFSVIVRRWQDAVSADPGARQAGPDDPDPRTVRR